MPLSGQLEVFPDTGGLQGVSFCPDRWNQTGTATETQRDLAHCSPTRPFAEFQTVHGSAEAALMAASVQYLPTQVVRHGQCSGSRDILRQIVSAEEPCRERISMFRAPRGREDPFGSGLGASLGSRELGWSSALRWPPPASAASISQRSTTLEDTALLAQDPLATTRATGSAPDRAYFSRCLVAPDPL